MANELLDALPVHRVDRRNGELRELFVDLAIKADSPGQPAFVERAGSPSTPALAARLESEGIELIEGARAEICLRLDAWVAELDRAIERGFAVVIDYGYPAAELYAAERAEGTLRVYSRHRVGADPFRAIGRQDLTAHVDFTAVARAFEAVGWRILGLRRQAEFLIGSGMEGVLATLQADETAGLEARLLLRSAVGRMLDPRQTGGFRVLVAAKGLPAGVTFAGLRDVRTR